MKKTGLLVLLAAIIAFGCWADSGLAEEQGMTRIKLVNMSDDMLSLYIDGKYACTAMADFSCSKKVPAGIHRLTASAVDGRSETKEPLYYAAGITAKWYIYKVYRQ